MREIRHPATSELDLATILRTLGDPVRLGIVRLLSDDQERNCTIVGDEMEIPKSTLSYHLRMLRESGVTRTRAEGTERHISLRREDLESVYPGLLDVLVAKTPAGSAVD
jgi:DNA-binding transcriptional ArsR family regulator